MKRRKITRVEALVKRLWGDLKEPEFGRLPGITIHHDPSFSQPPTAFPPKTNHASGVQEKQDWGEYPDYASDLTWE